MQDICDLDKGKGFLTDCSAQANQLKQKSPTLGAASAALQLQYQIISGCTWSCPFKIHVSRTSSHILWRRLAWPPTAHFPPSHFH